MREGSPARWVATGVLLVTVGGSFVAVAFEPDERTTPISGHTDAPRPPAVQAASNLGGGGSRGGGGVSAPSNPGNDVTRPARCTERCMERNDRCAASCGSLRHCLDRCRSIRSTCAASCEGAPR